VPEEDNLPGLRRQQATPLHHAWNVRQCVRHKRSGNTGYLLAICVSRQAQTSAVSTDSDNSVANLCQPRTSGYSALNLGTAPICTFETRLTRAIYLNYFSRFCSCLLARPVPNTGRQGSFAHLSKYLSIRLYWSAGFLCCCNAQIFFFARRNICAHERNRSRSGIASRHVMRRCDERTQPTRVRTMPRQWNGRYGSTAGGATQHRKGHATERHPGVE
jgi:hypothetical protein